jgi:hypothetical protein
VAINSIRVGSPGVPVLEMPCEGIAVMRRRSDSWLVSIYLLYINTIHPRFEFYWKISNPFFFPLSGQTILQLDRTPPKFSKSLVSTSLKGHGFWNVKFRKAHTKRFRVAMANTKVCINLLFDLKKDGASICISEAHGVVEVLIS